MGGLLSDAFLGTASRAQSFVQPHSLFRAVTPRARRWARFMIFRTSSEGTPANAGCPVPGRDRTIQSSRRGSRRRVAFSRDGTMVSAPQELGAVPDRGEGVLACQEDLKRKGKVWFVLGRLGRCCRARLPCPSCPVRGTRSSTSPGQEPPVAFPATPRAFLPGISWTL